MEKNKTYHDNYRQIVRHDGDRYQIKDGKRVDEVVLRFDEDEQKFYARIVNPSQHTQYLYENNRLGIALCKLTTGKSWGKGPMSSYHTGRTEYQYHPRWTRYGQHFVPVTSLSQEFEIQYQFQQPLSTGSKGGKRPSSSSFDLTFPISS